MLSLTKHAVNPIKNMNTAVLVFHLRFLLTFGTDMCFLSLLLLPFRVSFVVYVYSNKIYIRILYVEFYSSLILFDEFACVTHSNHTYMHICTYV